MSQRLIIAISLLVLIPIGLLTRAYGGPAEAWIHHHLGGILYEIFWCLIACWVWPKMSPAKIAVSVFVLTSLLELTQRYHPFWFEEIRSHFIAQILIGTTFDLYDFPHYAIGCTIGWWWVKHIQTGK